MDNNEGIVNKGNITAGNLAVGHGASINVGGDTNQDVQQLTALLDQLLAKLQNTQEPIANKEELVKTVATLKEEVNKPSPSKLTIKAVGSALLSSLKYVNTLAPIAESVWHHISTLFA